MLAHAQGMPLNQSRLASSLAGASWEGFVIENPATSDQERLVLSRTYTSWSSLTYEIVIAPQIW